MKPFKKNKEKIDSKVPTDIIESKEPVDEYISSKTPSEEQFDPFKEKIEPPKVKVEDFNPPPKKSMHKDEINSTKRPTDYGKNTDGYENQTKPLPKELKEKKGKNEQKPSSSGKSESKSSKEEGKGVPKEALKEKKKDQKLPVSYGVADGDKKEQGKNKSLPKEVTNKKERTENKIPVTTGAFKEKGTTRINRKIPKNEQEQAIKEKKPPATMNMQTKTPNDKVPKDEIPKERIFTKKPK